MANLKVKSESMPARCEVCHQTDMFDSENNYCARCEAVPVDQPEQIEIEELRKYIDKKIKPWLDNPWVDNLPRIVAYSSLFLMIFMEWRSGRLFHQPIFCIIFSFVVGIISGTYAFAICLVYAFMRSKFTEEPLTHWVIRLIMMLLLLLAPVLPFAVLLFL
jgi:hypothetical protein